MARWYLHSQGISQDVFCRFDVLGIVWGPGETPQIAHIENAFGT
jgi:Holliday junction resolvase-like predicted endonuclease